MNAIFIFLGMAFLTASGKKYRNAYQDQNSWSFQHPTARYTKAKFDKTLVKEVARMPMDTSSDVRLISDNS